MANQVLEKIVFSDRHDRLLWIQYNFKRELIGVNFMQGGTHEKEMEDFKENYTKNDERLLKFVRLCERFNGWDTKSLVSNINRAIWMMISLETEGLLK